MNSWIGKPYKRTSLRDAILSQPEADSSFHGKEPRD